MATKPERYEKVDGVYYKRAHIVRSLTRANYWKKHYHALGYNVRIEKPRRGEWIVYIRKRK